jgi:hypothetical protein
MLPPPGSGASGVCRETRDCLRHAQSAAARLPHSTCPRPDVRGFLLAGPGPVAIWRDPQTADRARNAGPVVPQAWAPPP